MLSEQRHEAVAQLNALVEEKKALEIDLYQKVRPLSVLKVIKGVCK